MTHLQEGDIAPAFTGIDENGATITLDQYKGKKLILFFYPADNTPTCTTEVCGLRDNYEDLRDKGFELLGISPDSVKKHQNFKNKYQLPFPLLADTNKTIISLYGVWGPKKLFGISYDGLLRTTFVIDEQGRIAKVFDKVESSRHTAQILEALN